MNILTPKRFKWCVRYLLTPCFWLGMFALALGLYTGLLTSPPDYQQGETVRIMYIHVPAAWMALGIYSFLALSGVSYLIWKNPLSDTLAHAIAPVGALFTLTCLITGSLWGKPIWGTWWVWDARLTSMLVLFIMYLGYILLEGAFSSDERNATARSVLAIAGAINLPIIKFSVEWWNTLHQPASILRTEGIAIHPSMQLPLFSMLLAYALLTLWITLTLGERSRINKKLQRVRFRHLRNASGLHQQNTLQGS